MSKILICLSFCVISAFACGGCRSLGDLINLKENSISNYNTRDEDIAKTVEKVTKLIHEAHQVIELRNKVLMLNIQNLLAHRALIEKNILFNQKVINELESLINAKQGVE